MDPKFWFWTAALVDLGIIVWCGRRGVRAIRGGDVRAHRRMMLTATALVGVFLGSYVLKVMFLGKEDRSAWTGFDYGVLYVHELCVTVMLLAGIVALVRAWGFRRALEPGPSLPSAPLPGGPSHRRAGTWAKRAGLLAFITAFGVWGGMLWRL